jgi:hypothetical protein
MPAKTTKADQPYEIDGKTFTWQPLDDDDVRGNLPPVRIPMRVKLKVIRDLAGQDLDAAAMFDIFERLIPDQAEALDEMDLNDFQAMFMAWQKEYEALSGASLGE